LVGIWIAQNAGVVDFPSGEVYGFAIFCGLWCGFKTGGVLGLRLALDQVYYSGARDVLHLSYSLSPVVNDYLSQVSLPNEKQKLSKN
jgi:hypothetical protein